MLGMAVLFLGGAAVALMSNSNGAVPFYYLVNGLLLTAITGIWFLRHRPALLGTTKAYLYTLGGTELGLLFGGLIGPLSGCGPWLTLGAGMVAYGVLERARVIVTAGAVAFVGAFLAATISAPVVGGAMQTAAAAAFAVAAYRLHTMKHGRRPPRRDVDLSNLILK
jgi:hypothetical protein